MLSTAVCVGNNGLWGRHCGLSSSPRARARRLGHVHVPSCKPPKPQRQLSGAWRHEGMPPALKDGMHSATTRDCVRSQPATAEGRAPSCMGSLPSTPPSARYCCSTASVSLQRMALLPAWGGFSHSTQRGASTVCTHIHAYTHTHTHIHIGDRRRCIHYTMDAPQILCM